MLDSFILFLICLIAAQHLGFLVLEMFLWTKPLGRRVFSTSAEFAKASASLAKNQGLYNGFLSAGLVWSLLASGEMATQLKLFFVSCVLIAGVYGGLTVGRKILMVQALPAALTLALIILNR